MTVLSFRALTEKEVICTADSARLGYINDLEFDAETGSVCAFLLPDSRFFAFSARAKYRVRREWITGVGEDLLLVCRYETLGAPCKKK